MFNLKDELDPEKEESMIIEGYPAKIFSDDQKKAIQLVLTKMFTDQIASTSVYHEIVGALIVAMNSPEVIESSNRFIVGLKDLIRVFFKNIPLSGDRLAKVRDALETLKALAIVQKKYVDSSNVDDAMTNQVILLQERLSAHIAPMSIALQGENFQEMIKNQQKNILEFIIDIVKASLAVLPIEPNYSKAGSPPILAEPLVADYVIIDE